MTEWEEITGVKDAFPINRHEPEGATPFQKGEHEARYKFASQFVKGKLVLDIGCGTGYGSKILSGAGAKYVTGVDVAPSAIHSCVTPGMDFIVEDATDLKVLSNHFDVVVMLEVIEHIEDQEKAISEARRVLKDDGILILSTPNQAEHPGKKFNPEHVRELTRAELNDLLEPHFDKFAVLDMYFTTGCAIVNPVYEALTIDKHDFQEPPFMVAVCYVGEPWQPRGSYIPFTTDRTKLRDFLN